MKQEIVCPTCENELLKMFPNKSPYPGEYVNFVSGKTIRGMFCDQCGSELREGAECCAFTIYTDKNPFKDWEDSYIIRSKK